MLFMAGVAANAFADHIVLSRGNAMVAVLALAFCWVAGEYYVSTATLGTYLILYFGYSDRLKLKILKPIAPTSYGIYIFGFPLQQLCTYIFGGRMDPYLNFVLSAIPAILLAYVTWRFVEKPCMKLKNVRFLEDIVPASVKEKYEKGREAVFAFADKVFPTGWIAFIGVICIVCAVGYVADMPASAYDFASTHYNAAIGEGWFTQQNESYCWVTDTSGTRLLQRQKDTELYVTGYLPPDFTMISELTVSVDGNAYSVQVVPGNLFEVHLPVAQAPFFGKKHTVQLLFNGKRTPDEGTADVRELSATISYIGFR